MSTVEAIARLQWHAGQIIGVGSAPNYPIENSMVFPFSIGYLVNSEFVTITNGFCETLDDIDIEVHYGRAASLPKAVETAMPFRDLYIQRLMADIKLNNTCETIEDIKAFFGFLSYGDPNIKENIGYKFTITIKVAILASS